MAISNGTGEAEAHAVDPHWDVNNPLVRVDRSGDASRSIQVQHLDYPYEDTLPTQPPQISGYFALAYDYLNKVNCKLKIDAALLKGLKPCAPDTDTLQLRWLGTDGELSHSYWLNRFDFAALPHGSATPPVVDRTLILLAGLTALKTLTLLGGQGIRILAQVRVAAAGQVLVRITGVVSTVPSFSTILGSLAVSEAFNRERMGTMWDLMKQGLPEANTPTDIGWTLLPDVQIDSGKVQRIELRATTALPESAARESTQLDASSHQLVTRFDVDKSGSVTKTVFKRPLIAFAHAKALVLKQDPFSRQGASSYWENRPSLPSGKLDPARETELWGNLPSSAGKIQLADGDVQVRHVRLIDPPIAEGTPKRVPKTSNAKVRSNEFTAVSVFFHGQSLFRRIRGHGLIPGDLLRFVSLPLDIHYRAGILPGYGDGRTINAQVRWAISVPEVSGPDPVPVRRLELRFALGDLSMAAGRLPANMPSATERHPLGVAIDPRWCWHEFGHVLIAGATGTLELPFAHSVGDALAAIECDPGSALAGDNTGAADNSCAWRHVTFPWIHIPRRHDRDVQKGWSWTETVSGVDPPHGYRSEQLMSTSLFRLYRALGGDCQETSLAGIEIPARAEREQASNYVSYLIMRTLASLGPANVSPCTSVQMFVHALRSVDCATSGQPGPGGYIGGTSNKVIQWAFERQGLYGRPLPGSAIIGPEGLHDGSPQVDLHIEDRRAAWDGPYTPVDLLGSSWFSASGAIDVQQEDPSSFGRQRIKVTVQNRGADVAGSTVVQVWCAPLPAASGIPAFPGPQWVLVGHATGSVPGHDNTAPGQLQFPAIVWQPIQAGRYVLLAAASCPLDRANIDPATAYPCVTEPGPVARLVAFDNNLGLTIVST